MIKWGWGLMRIVSTAIKAVLLLFLVCFGALLLLAPLIASRALEQGLSVRGFTPNTVEIAQITPWQSKIEQLELPLRADSMAGRLRLTNLQLAYEPVWSASDFRASAVLDSGGLELHPNTAVIGQVLEEEVTPWWLFRPPLLPLSVIRFNRFDIKDSLFFNLQFGMRGSLFNSERNLKAALIFDDQFGNRGNGKVAVERQGSMTAKVRLIAGSLKPFSQFLPALEQAAPFLDETEPFRANAELKFDGPVFAGAGDVALKLANSTVLPMQGELQHDLQLKKGKLAYVLKDLDISSTNLGLGDLPISTQGVVVDTGRLSVQGDMSWSWNVESGRWELALGQLKGNLGGITLGRDPYLVSNAEVEFGFESLIPLRTFPKQPIFLRVDSLSMGVDIENIAVKAHIDSSPKSLIPRVRLEDVSVEIFGARVQMDYAVFDPSKSLNAFVLRIRGLDLQKLLEKYPQEDLIGTGVLDGVLPVVISRAGKPAIPGGRLSARAPGGVIQYASAIAEGEGSISQAQQVFQILKKFDYQAMKVDVSYRESGDLMLGIQLKGSSSRFQNGRVVNLNINVEENLPALLKSVLVTKGVGEKVSKGIVDHLGPSK